ncbi:hypothetical protein GDO81_002516 [Engystomops pustulosus]|uniref:Uncharacterized protein n=1 Tax=Engystomops pustulosus TaxID=76066 RepID=A0AAV7DMD3_ENGPU|nr:hypothetical protein GDO81_002516 [Engystomops pustulosus]
MKTGFKPVVVRKQKCKIEKHYCTISEGTCHPCCPHNSHTAPSYREGFFCFYSKMLRYLGGAYDLPRPSGAGRVENKFFSLCTNYPFMF